MQQYRQRACGAGIDKGVAALFLDQVTGNKTGAFEARINRRNSEGICLQVQLAHESVFDGQHLYHGSLAKMILALDDFALDFMAYDKT